MSPLDGGRLRFLGGSTNHWGGWCRPLDEIDFESRDWVPHSGWPFAREEIEPYFARAQALVEAGPWVYDAADQAVSDSGPVLRLGPGGVYTSWFQFSKTQGRHPAHPFRRALPGRSEARGRASRPLLNANVTGIRLSADASHVDHLDVATLSRQPADGEAALYGAGGGRDRECAAAAGLQRCDEGGRRQRQ